MKPSVLIATAGAALLAALPAAAADLAAQGKDLFAANCAACHNADASGIAGVAPPLANALRDRLGAPAGQAYLANVLVHGLAGPIESQGQSFNGIMPPFAALPDASLLAVMAWLNTQNGQAATAGGAEALAKARAERKTPGAVRKLREAR
ncbi:MULTISPECIES: c-type cytochrome [unclassified Cupriavidus]|uniref:c-type cytochrome n=1 Tax=unclassified Cupriavidus TaxID=2640874 RepID=UPI001AE8F1B0|nr:MULTISPECIES: c-type cytochrome [unclassified Cupriavidus]MBP0627803.1 c-type cytochrome [Cupriavidus sp. AcVe19-1a]MBP0637706.1 c-type cytochrome [Cupriavidus sp. AcVe19-6a]